MVAAGDLDLSVSSTAGELCTPAGTGHPAGSRPEAAAFAKQMIQWLRSMSPASAKQACLRPQYEPLAVRMLSTAEVGGIIVLRIAHSALLT